MKGLVEKACLEWSAECIPPNAPPEQRHAMQSAFCCGMAGSLTVIADIVKDEKLTRDMMVTKIANIAMQAAGAIATMAVARFEAEQALKKEAQGGRAPADG